MHRMTVGGRTLELDKEQVLRKMRGVLAEPIREHLVEVGGTAFPPKQVLAVVTEWDRQSFTTMEAQRVLTRVGFVCRRAGKLADGQAAWIRSAPDPGPATMDDRIASLEAGLVVANEAIAGLASRIRGLEAQG